MPPLVEKQPDCEIQNGYQARKMTQVANADWMNGAISSLAIGLRYVHSFTNRVASRYSIQSHVYVASPSFFFRRWRGSGLDLLPSKSSWAKDGQCYLCKWCGYLHSTSFAQLT